MKAEVVASHRGGVWAWVMQRVTAVLLIVCLAIHLILTHLFNIGQLDSANIAARLANSGLTAVDIILLAAGIFHALNGLRMVLMDYWFTARGRAVALTGGLWVVGLAFLGYGIWALWPWIG
jgi:succinate dehydrogenase hydrophobic membrane anchor protein